MHFPFGSPYCPFDFPLWGVISLNPICSLYAPVSLHTCHMYNAHVTAYNPCITSPEHQTPNPRKGTYRATEAHGGPATRGAKKPKDPTNAPTSGVGIQGLRLLGFKGKVQPCGYRV